MCTRHFLQVVVDILDDSDGMIIGRGSAGGIVDKGVSRKHVKFQINKTTNELTITRLSVNAAYVRPLYVTINVLNSHLLCVSSIIIDLLILLCCC